MKYEDFKEAYSEAKYTMNIVDSMSDDMAKMLIGRLRKVNGWYLEELKKELTQFNARTHNWKS